MSRTESESEEEDDDYFSVEPVEIDEEAKEDHTYDVKKQNVSGTAASSEVLTGGEIEGAYVWRYYINTLQGE